MSKTRKIRRARKARDVALALAAKEKQCRKHLKAQTASNRVKFQYLTELVGRVTGDTNLFHAMVHGVAYSNVKPLSNQVEVPRVEDMSVREMESRAGMANIAHVHYDVLDLVCMKLEEHNLGHVIKTYKGDTPVLAMDAKCIEFIPERMLTVELSECAAEAIKQAKGKVNHV